MPGFKRLSSSSTFNEFKTIKYNLIVCETRVNILQRAAYEWKTKLIVTQHTGDISRIFPHFVMLF